MTDKHRQFNGLLHCARQVLTQEGPMAFYKGFGMCWARVRIWTSSLTSNVRQSNWHSRVRISLELIRWSACWYLRSCVNCLVSHLCSFPTLFCILDYGRRCKIIEYSYFPETMFDVCLHEGYGYSLWERPQPIVQHGFCSLPSGVDTVREYFVE